MYSIAGAHMGHLNGKPVSRGREEGAFVEFFLSNTLPVVCYYENIA
jgi:hypothetical protein